MTPSLTVPQHVYYHYTVALVSERVNEQGMPALWGYNDDVERKDGVQNGSGMFLDFVGVFRFTKGDVRVPSPNKGNRVEYVAHTCSRRTSNKDHSLRSELCH